MPHVERSGLKLHVQVLGEGPPVAMLHGLLVGSMASWYFGAAPRLARRFRVLLSDLRGHGLSDPSPTGYDLATLGADLHEILPLAGAGSATLVGHSYGALIALRYALAHRHRVARLVLVDAPLPPSQVPELDAFLARRPEEMLSALPDALQSGVADGSRQGRRLVAQLRRLVEGSLLADLQAEPDFADADLAGLDLPVLLVYGDRSGCRAAGERLARVLPRARLHFLPGGHFLPTEQAAALADLLDQELVHG